MHLVPVQPDLVQLVNLIVLTVGDLLGQLELLNLG